MDTFVDAAELDVRSSSGEDGGRALHESVAALTGRWVFGLR
jgi:hypothetical protein